MAASTVTPLAKYKLVFLGDQVGAALFYLCLCRGSCQKKDQWVPWFRSGTAQLLQAQRTSPQLARRLRFNRLLPAGTCLLVQSVGKTSIITRFMYDKFDTTYQVCSASSSTSCELACGLE